MGFALWWVALTFLTGLSISVPCFVCSVPTRIIMRTDVHFVYGVLCCMWLACVVISELPFCSSGVGSIHFSLSTEAGLRLEGFW